VSSYWVLNCYVFVIEDFVLFPLDDFYRIIRCWFKFCNFFSLVEPMVVFLIGEAEEFIFELCFIGDFYEFRKIGFFF